ncbi:MAG: hypothetical protein ACI8WB_004729 [Phenylobacterium sp.]|jgi:hypothetical protein
MTNTNEQLELQDTVLAVLMEKKRQKPTMKIVM